MGLIEQAISGQGGLLSKQSSQEPGSLVKQPRRKDKSTTITHVYAELTVASPSLKI